MDSVQRSRSAVGAQLPPTKPSSLKSHQGRCCHRHPYLIIAKTAVCFIASLQHSVLFRLLFVCRIHSASCALSIAQPYLPFGILLVPHAVSPHRPSTKQVQVQVPEKNSATPQNSQSKASTWRDSLHKDSPTHTLIQFALPRQR